MYATRVTQARPRVYRLRSYASRSEGLQPRLAWCAPAGAPSRPSSRPGSSSCEGWPCGRPSPWGEPSGGGAAKASVPRRAKARPEGGAAALGGEEGGGVEGARALGMAELRSARAEARLPP